MNASPVFVDGGASKFIPEMREYRAKELIALDHFKEELARNEESSGRQMRLRGRKSNRRGSSDG